MSRSQLTLPAVLALAAVAAGCDGAASARVPGDDRRATAAVADAAPQPAANAVAAADLPRRDSTGTFETTFDDLKFPMEKTDDFAESLLTARVKGLFDQRIRIRGYMYPTPRTRGLKQFVLVRDNLECCFGPGAALFDCILVTMAGDATAEYSIYPVAVEGTFRFEVLAGPDGHPLAIYQLAGEAVK